MIEINQLLGAVSFKPKEFHKNSHFGSKEGSLVTISQLFSEVYCHVCVSQDFVHRIAQIENSFVRTSLGNLTSI